MEDLISYFKNSKKNLVNLLLLAIMVLALPLGVNLVREQQLLKSRAAGDPIKFTGANVEKRGDKWVAKSPQITVELISSLGPSAGNAAQGAAALSGSGGTGTSGGAGTSGGGSSAGGNQSSSGGSSGGGSGGSLQNGTFQSLVPNGITAEQITAEANQIIGSGNWKTEENQFKLRRNLFEKYFGHEGEWLTPQQIAKFKQTRTDIGEFINKRSEGGNADGVILGEWFPGGSRDTDGLRILLQIAREDNGKPITTPDQVLAMVGIKEKMITTMGGPEGSRDWPATRFLRAWFKGQDKNNPDQNAINALRIMSKMPGQTGFTIQEYPNLPQAFTSSQTTSLPNLMSLLPKGLVGTVYADDNCPDFYQCSGDNQVFYANGHWETGWFGTFGSCKDFAEQVTNCSEQNMGCNNTTGQCEPRSGICTGGSYDTRVCDGNCGSCPEGEGLSSIRQCRADGSGYDDPIRECFWECAGTCKRTTSGGGGQCSGGCDDNNACTQDSCDEYSGNQCQHTNEPAGTYCDTDVNLGIVYNCDGVGSCSQPVIPPGGGSGICPGYSQVCNAGGGKTGITECYPGVGTVDDCKFGPNTNCFDKVTGKNNVCSSYPPTGGPPGPGSEPGPGGGGGNVCPASTAGLTACWIGAGCNSQNQASSDSACAANHGSGSKCVRTERENPPNNDGCSAGSNTGGSPSTAPSNAPSRAPSTAPSTSPSTRPSTSPSTSPAASTQPPAITTVSFKIAENPDELAGAQEFAYNSEPVVTGFTFRNQTPGDKFVWVEFKASNGRTARHNLQIKLLGPDPRALSCSLDFEGTNAVFNIKGQNFGAEQGSAKSGTNNLQVREWKDNEVKLIFQNPQSGQNFPVTLTNTDGQTASAQCGSVSGLSLGAKVFCRASSKHDTDNVDLVLTGVAGSVGVGTSGGVGVGSTAPSQTGPIRQKVKIDKDGNIQNLQTKLAEGSKYKVSLKAPKSLRKTVEIIAGGGTTNLQNFVLPVGDIFPLDGGDGKINNFDKSELNRQWIIAQAATDRSGDFNQDGRVNSIDWACMRFDFNKEDEKE